MDAGDQAVTCDLLQPRGYAHPGFSFLTVTDRPEQTNKKYTRTVESIYNTVSREQEIGQRAGREYKKGQEQR